MSTCDLSMEEMDVRDFDGVIMRGYGELLIRQADRESLTVEAHPDLLPRITANVVDGRLTLGQGGNLLDKLTHALETSLTRGPIRYTLTVKNLTSLVVYGAAWVRADGITSDQLSLRFRGAAEVNMESLAVGSLQVDLPVGGTVNASGRAAEQRISLRGAGVYTARQLKSDIASVRIRGAGSATVWAEDELAVSIGGIGSVKYYGSPRVSRRISALSTVSWMGEQRSWAVGQS